MLTIGRKVGESIKVGNLIEIKLVSANKSKLKILVKTTNKEAKEELSIVAGEFVKLFIVETVFGEYEITVKFIKKKGNNIWIGIEAPKSIKITRE